MGETKTLKRTTRMKMFLNEYYFGHSWWLSATRIIIGPVLLLIGTQMYDNSDRFDFAYGWLCLLYGMYMIVKPILWIVFRLDSFNSIDIQIGVSEEKLMMKDSIAQSEILLDGVQKLIKRKTYFVIQLAKFTKVYLPLELLTPDQIKILKTKIKK